MEEIGRHVKIVMHITSRGGTDAKQRIEFANQTRQNVAKIKSVMPHVRFAAGQWNEVMHRHDQFRARRPMPERRTHRRAMDDVIAGQFIEACTPCRPFAYKRDRFHGLRQLRHHRSAAAHRQIDITATREVIDQLQGIKLHAGPRITEDFGCDKHFHARPFRCADYTVAGPRPMNFTDTAIIIAAYNEASAIAAVLADLTQHAPGATVIVVDDASSDDTGHIARTHGAKVFRHAINRGQGAALQTGIDAAVRAGAKIIVTFDADGQHDAKDIAAMIEPIRAGSADVVLGSRFIEGSPNMPPLRRITLKLAVVLTRVLSGLAVTDTHNGFRALSADTARRIRLRQDRMAHASEILDQIARLGVRYVERPVHVHYSEYSLGKGQRNRDAVKVLLSVLMDKVTR